MSDENVGAPKAGPPSAQDWTGNHTLGLGTIVVFFVGMALLRPFGLLSTWIALMLALAAFILVAGHGIKHAWFGALIDERNKMSLSRLQMLAWTVIVLGAYATIAIARVATDASTALDVAIPQTLWLLMGISTTSLVGSPLIKSAKKEPTLQLNANDLEARFVEHGKDAKAYRVEGQIVSNTHTSAARWSDLFTGEEVSNVSHLDLAKIQMFFFTILIVLSYGVAIGSLLGGSVVPSALPEIGDGTLALLGISHSGYLVNKAVPLTRA